MSTAKPDASAASAGATMIDAVLVEPSSESPPLPTLRLPPHALEYDELRAGSDLRREYRDGGAVTISAPAGEPSVTARRAALHTTGVSSAALCGIGMLLLLALAAPFSQRFARLDAALRHVAIVLFALFCGGLYVLIWKVRYGACLDALAEARRESAVLHAGAGRLLVETAGPDGPRSYDLPAADIRRVRVTHFPSMGHAGGAEAAVVACVKVDLTDGSSIRLLPGHHAMELRSVASSLTHALGIPPEGPLSDRNNRYIWTRLGVCRRDGGVI